MKPLVSILIPAYNAEKWIRATIRSAAGQTWPQKEVIVVDDGSTDNTYRVARQFESSGVKVVTQENMGGGGARNRALALAQGDYIQWLDHDDILPPDKISQQLCRVPTGGDERTLLAGRFMTFFSCLGRAREVHSGMNQDLSPVDFFLHKFNEDAWLQIGAYLFSRKLSEMAGPWYEKQSTDDDGDYVARVVAQSERIIFVPEAAIYWRIGNTRSAGHSNTKAMRKAAFDATCRSIDMLLGLENSERTRAACLRFLQFRLLRYFSYDETELLSNLQTVASSLGGKITLPEIGWKLSLANKIIGWRNARKLQGYGYVAQMFLKRNIERYYRQFRCSKCANYYHCENFDRRGLPGLKTANDHTG